MAFPFVHSSEQRLSTEPSVTTSEWLGWGGMRDERCYSFGSAPSSLPLGRKALSPRFDKC